MQDIHHKLKKLTTSEIIEIFIDNHKHIWNAMKSTEHGYLNKFTNPHHLEGSVWTHTMMVLKKAEDYEYDNLIKLACLCHDIGKVYLYEDIEDKNIRRFTNHEAVSTFYAREVLKTFQEKYFLHITEVQYILSLVSQHGSLYNFFVDGRIPQTNHFKIADRFDSNTFSGLIKLYKCDHEGRFYNEKSLNDKSVYNDFEDILTIMEINEHKSIIRKYKANLIILIGLPRSGKSTWVSEQNFLQETIIISRDDLVMKYGIGNSYTEKRKSLTDEQQLKIDKEIQSNFNLAVKNSKDIVVDMTNMSKKSRNKWTKNAHGYYKKAIMFIEDKNVLMSRMTKEKNIPETVIDSMMKSFVYPNTEEFDTIILKG